MTRVETASRWGSLVAGLASVATLPVAIYLTRYSDRYELIHAGFAIPLAAALALLAISLARRARRLSVIRLGRGGGKPGLVRAGGCSGSRGSASHSRRWSRWASTGCSSTSAGREWAGREKEGFPRRN